MTSENPIEAVRRYVALGWHIVPLHGLKDDLTCTCHEGAACGSKAGKHPYWSDWVNKATTDLRVLEPIWTVRPEMNVGVLCGRTSGIVVLDIDPRHDGAESLVAWCAQNYDGNRVPSTYLSRTGGGGWHIFFRYPSEGDLRGRKLPSRNWLPGVDVKSDGGQVVLPPSRHLSGATYAWDSESHLPALPPSLLDAITDDGVGGRAGGGGNDGTSWVERLTELLNGIPEGERDERLYREACALMRVMRGNSDEVLAIILTAAARCVPPFDEDHAKDKVRRARRFYEQEAAKERYAHEWKPEIGPTSPVTNPATLLERPLPSRDVPDGFALTDGGNADRLLAVWGGHVRYAVEGTWYVWDEHRWKRDNRSKTVEAMMWTTVRNIATKGVPELYAREDVPEDWVTALHKHWRASERTNAIKAGVEAASSREGVRSSETDFDQDPLVLNVGNGVMDLRTGGLLPHDPTFMLTKLAPVSYDPEATCPRWQEYLGRVVPDDAVRDFLQEAVGYTLTGLTGEKCFFVLHGRANTGKTIFIQTVVDMLGDYAVSVSKGVFLKQRFEGHPTELASVRGARMITNSNEIARGEQWNEGRIKTMTGGERMVARFMHQNEFQFVPECKLWLSTNHHPGTRDFSGGLATRLRIVPFEQVIPEVEQVPRPVMLERLAEERAGILNWALAGLARSEGRGGRLVLPAQVMMAVEEYIEDEDVFGQFVEQYLRRDETSFVSSRDVLESFRQWAVGEGHDLRYLTPGNVKLLGRELQRLGLTSVKVQGHRGWRAVCGYERVGWT